MTATAVLLAQRASRAWLSGSRLTNRPFAIGTMSGMTASSRCLKCLLQGLQKIRDRKLANEMGCLRRSTPRMNAVSAGKKSLMPSRLEIQCGTACSRLSALAPQKTQRGYGVGWDPRYVSPSAASSSRTSRRAPRSPQLRAAREGRHNRTSEVAARGCPAAGASSRRWISELRFDCGPLGRQLRAARRSSCSNIERGPWRWL